MSLYHYPKIKKTAVAGVVAPKPVIQEPVSISTSKPAVQEPARVSAPSSKPVAQKLFKIVAPKPIVQETASVVAPEPKRPAVQETTIVSAPKPQKPALQEPAPEVQEFMPQEAQKVMPQAVYNNTYINNTTTTNVCCSSCIIEFEKPEIKIAENLKAETCPNCSSEAILQ